MRTVVIGGGVIGLSCAWRLVRQCGHRVTLLEARRCGEGASLAALGALWPASALNRSPAAQAQRHALMHYARFLQELHADCGLPISYRQLGRLEIMTSPEAAARGRAEVAAANTDWSLGDCMEFLDAPNYLGTPTPFGAVHCRLTAHVRVPELLAALRAACQNAGVIIHEHTPLTHLKRIGNEWLANHIPADVVLLAAGAWTNTILPDAPPIIPVKGQALALRPPAGLTLPRILKKGPIYLVPWPEHNEILVGSTTEHVGFYEIPTDDARETLRAGAADLLPTLRDAQILRHWTGLRPKSKPGPLLTEFAPNAWLCTGHYKTGIAMCGEAGRALAARLAPASSATAP